MAAKPYSSSRVKWRFSIALLCLIDKIPRDSQSENKAVEWIVWNKERFSIARAVIEVRHHYIKASTLQIKVGVSIDKRIIAQRYFMLQS